MEEPPAGLDLASEEHRLVVVDGDGRRRDEQRVVHSEDGLTALVRRLRELRGGRGAVEQPNGRGVGRPPPSGPAPPPIFPDVDSPIALAFLERYPSPIDARSLGVKRLSGFLARHGYCGRRSPEGLLARLRSPPQGRAGRA